MGRTKSSVGAKIDPALDAAITKLLKQVTLEKKDENGKQMYSLTDVLKVVDRKLKFEAIKVKVDDAGYGSAFGSDDDEEEDDNDGA